MATTRAPEPPRSDPSSPEDAEHALSCTVDGSDHSNLFVEKNLCGADLRGSDLSGADLSSRDLSGADLTDANLFGACLKGTVLRGACLRNAELSATDFEAAQLDHADLGGATIAGARLRNVEAFGVDLRGASLTATDLTGSDLRTAKLEEAILRESTLVDVDLSQANLRGADISESDVHGADFFRADIRRVSLENLKGYEHARWIGVDISDVNFVGAYRIRRFILDQNFLEDFRSESRFSEWAYRIWWLTSDCGRSMTRWCAWTLFAVLLYAGLFSLVGIDYGSHPTPISAIYFSVVTLTTLGYGDVTPITAAGQVVTMMAVTTGYFMLGGLLSILSNKMARRGE